MSFVPTIAVVVDNHSPQPITNECAENYQPITNECAENYKPITNEWSLRVTWVCMSHSRREERRRLIFPSPSADAVTCRSVVYQPVTIIQHRPLSQRPSMRTDSYRQPWSGQQASVDRQAPYCTRNGHGEPGMLDAYVGPVERAHCIGRCVKSCLL